MIEPLPATRDKQGHLVQYPGRIAYVHDDWRLVYIGTIDGRHEFFAEKSHRQNLGDISFAEAKKQLIELARRDP